MVCEISTTATFPFATKHTHLPWLISHIEVSASLLLPTAPEPKPSNDTCDNDTPRQTLRVYLGIGWVLIAGFWINIAKRSWKVLDIRTMASGYPAPPVYHHQPEMAGAPPQHAGYAPLPPPMPSNSYYQDPMANPHRPNMPPSRANMMPPSIPGPGSGPGPGPRDRAADLGASENGLGSQPSTQNTVQAETDESSSINLEPREGSDGTRKYR